MSCPSPAAGLKRSPSVCPATSMLPPRSAATAELQSCEPDTPIFLHDACQQTKEMKRSVQRGGCGMGRKEGRNRISQVSKWARILHRFTTWKASVHLQAHTQNTRTHTHKLGHCCVVRWLRCSNITRGEHVPLDVHVHNACTQWLN